MAECVDVGSLCSGSMTYDCESLNTEGACIGPGCCNWSGSPSGCEGTNTNPCTDYGSCNENCCYKTPTGCGGSNSNPCTNYSSCNEDCCYKTPTGCGGSNSNPCNDYQNCDDSCCTATETECGSGTNNHNCTGKTQVQCEAAEDCCLWDVYLSHCTARSCGGYMPQVAPPYCEHCGCSSEGTCGKKTCFAVGPGNCDYCGCTTTGTCSQRSCPSIGLGYCAYCGCTITGTCSQRSCPSIGLGYCAYCGCTPQGGCTKKNCTALGSIGSCKTCTGCSCCHEITADCSITSAKTYGTVWTKNNAIVTHGGGIVTVWGFLWSGGAKWNKIDPTAGSPAVHNYGGNCCF